MRPATLVQSVSMAVSMTFHLWHLYKRRGILRRGMEVLVEGRLKSLVSHGIGTPVETAPMTKTLIMIENSRHKSAGCHLGIVKVFRSVDDKTGESRYSRQKLQQKYTKQSRRPRPLDDEICPIATGCSPFRSRMDSVREFHRPERSNLLI